MLYNLKWEYKSEVLSLIMWLERQDPDKTYDARKPRSCLLGQWLRATGEVNVLDRSVGLSLREPFDTIALIAPFTFGAALERARGLA